jgi:cytochrome c553
MIHWKPLAGVGAVVLAIAAVAAAQDKPAAPAAAFPAWAFPGPKNESIPGSKEAYSLVQMYDRTTAVDWFPKEHPVMPPSVGGRLPKYACGFCHLPEGAGRSENAALAGLPEVYLRQQIADMKSGLRKTPEPHFGPVNNMLLTIAQISDQDADDAARYFASLKYTKHLKIIETNDIAHPSTDAFVYVFDKAAPHEPLGERIVEGPDDFERFEMRDPNSTFTAYVPPGAIVRGAALAKGDGGAKPSCETCHGAGLKGGPIGPPIAGRLPTGLFRQMLAFQQGTRNGAGAGLMKPIVAGVRTTDMIDLAAYVASLEP